MIYYNNERLSISPWIASRTYFFGKENSRTYISNEKSHTYVQLDGLASDLWRVIENGDVTEFSDFVDKNALSADLPSFLGDLGAQGLLTFKGSTLYETEKTAFSSTEEDANFIVERNAWLRSNRFLSGIFLELTYRCNLKCVHCYNPKNSPNVEIPFNKAKRIIDEAYELGCLSVTLSGGESTTYSHFIELVAYIRNKRMSVEIFTNGQLLYDDEKLYKDLLALYPHRVCLSLYGITEQTHEKITSVPGSFLKVKSIIERLRSDDVDVQIKNFLLNLNCGECIEVKKYGLSIGASVISDISLIPTVEGDKKTFRYVVGENELFRLFTDKESPLYVGEKPATFDIAKNGGDSLCLGGFDSLCVTPFLDVTVCVSLPFPVGNLTEQSLITIFNDSFDSKTCRLFKWKQITCEDLPECYKKDYCKFCHYCPGMGFLENGMLKKSDVLCLQAKVKQKAFDYIVSHKEAY